MSTKCLPIVQKKKKSQHFSTQLRLCHIHNISKYHPIMITEMFVEDVTQNYHYKKFTNNYH